VRPGSSVALVLALLVTSAGCAGTTHRHSVVPHALLVGPLDLATLDAAVAVSGPVDLSNLNAEIRAEVSTETAWRRALGDFGSLPEPPVVPIFPSGKYTNDSPVMVWWPNLSGGDAALRRLRTRYLRKRVYGFGGIAISCPPTWSQFYPPMSGVRVRSILREYGIVEWLAGGRGAGAPYAIGLGFLGYAPLRFVVDPPSVTAGALAPNYDVPGMPGPCPEFELADFQVETKLSLEPPPFPIPATLQPIRPGMSRDALIWTRGYPEELATKAAMRRESVWRYACGMGQCTTVTFRHDRVLSVYVPPMM
jgi:hypothetical protein